MIALLTPVPVAGLARSLDWPFLVGTAAPAAMFLARGRLGRLEGMALAALELVYLGLHVTL